jgi:hypothetical protein
MEIYLLGVYIALLVNLVALVFQFFRKFGIRARNFSRTGLKYSVVDGSFQENPRSWYTLAFLWFNLLIFAPLTSWFHVLWYLGVKVYAFVNRVPIPEKVKELQFQLGAADLSKEKVIEVLGELAKASGKVLQMPGEDENSDILALRKDFTATLELNRGDRKFTIHSHTEDYLSSFYTIEEYRIEGTEVHSRTIEKRDEHAGSPEEYDIKDNVVLESEITERYKTGFHFKNLDEHLENLRREIPWKPITYKIMRYFILSRHPEQLSPTDFRTFMRSESERIKNGIRRLKESVTEPNWEFVETGEGYSIATPQNADKETNTAVNDRAVAKLSDEGVAQFGLTHTDVWQAKEILAAIDEYLVKK